MGENSVKIPIEEKQNQEYSLDSEIMKHTSNGDGSAEDTTPRMISDLGQEIEFYQVKEDEIQNIDSHQEREIDKQVYASVHKKREKSSAKKDV